MGYNPNSTGTAFKGSSRSVATNFVNATGSFLPKASVVSINTSGQIVLIDITNTSSVDRFAGLTNVAMPIAATGGVSNVGRIEDVTTSFSVGDALYVNVDGSLTNIKPDYGVGAFVAGCYVIHIGLVVKNEFNGALKDILLNPVVVGQL